MKGITAAFALSILLLGSGASVAQDPPPDSTSEEPLDLGIEEHAERRLAQIDVAVTGPPEVIGNLTSEDFQVFVGDLVVSGGAAFTPSFADRICPAAQSVAAVAPTAKTASVTSPEFHYVFFFDQTHLTFVGRSRAMNLARELIETLIVDGSRATIVSTNVQLATYARESDDLETLLRAVDELEADPEQTSGFGENMENRLRQVLWWRFNNDVNKNPMPFSRERRSQRYLRGSLRRFEQSLAYQFQKEEIVQASRSLRRLSMVLRSQADHAPPKVLFYFADTMISRPGQAYIQVANAWTPLTWKGARQHTDTGPVDPWAAVEPFDAVLYDAAASGVRLYPIQAEGLVQGRVRQSAKHSLGSMAKETGGKHFINGVVPLVIADQVREDLSCVYLLSFDPAELAEDERHGVVVEVNHPQVQVNAPSKFLLRSKEGQQRADLVAALTAPDTNGIEGRLSGTLLPTGFRDGKYTALLQMRIPASPTLDAVWDLGFSLLWRDAVRESDEQRISVGRSTTPVVVEHEVELSLSDFELMLVAQEQTTEEIMTGHLTGRWRDPRNAPLSIGPIRAAQPLDARFVRGEKTRSGGVLGLAEREPIRSDHGVTILTLVCRDPEKRPVNLQVTQRLSGSLGLKLLPSNLELVAGQRCGLVRATVPEGHLLPGTLEYLISVTDRKRQTVASVRRFVVVDGLEDAQLAAY